MADTPVPTLSISGWISDPTRKLDTLLSHALVAEYSQSNRWLGEITSFPYYFALYSSDRVKLCNELDAALTRYLNRYYDQAEVTVTSEDSGKGDDSYNVKIGIGVWVNGVYHEAYKGLEVMGSTFKELTEASNG